MRNKHLFVRPAKTEDAGLFEEWSINTPNNGFDPEVAKYPSTITWCVYDHHGPLAFMPIQRPMVLDSLASRPNATKSEIATALKEIVQNCVTQSHVVGSGEILFMGTENGTNEMAANQLFEEVPYKVYRLKLKDLSCEFTQK